MEETKKENISLPEKKANKKASFRIKSLPKGEGTGFYNLDETIANYPVLPKEELNASILSAKRIPELEKSLQKAKESGDEAKIKELTLSLSKAKADHEKAILSNLRLVIKLAKEVSYGYTKVPFEDLVQDGILGLEKAIERFDPSLGFAFSTFATSSIKEAIRVSLRKSTQSVHIAESLLDDAKKVKDATERLSQRLLRAPTLEEIAKETGFTPSYVDECRALPLGGTLSLDTPFTSDDGSNGDSYGANIADESENDLGSDLTKEEEEEELSGALKILSPREREVIERVYGLNDHEEETLEEIGKSLGVTRERVRQIKDAALHKMGKDLKKDR